MEKNQAISSKQTGSLQAVLNALVRDEVGLKPQPPAQRAASTRVSAPSRSRHAGARALPLDLAFLQTDPELTHLYKACLAAQGQFDDLVQDFGVDDAMTAVAALQVDSLMKAYEERVRELRAKAGQRDGSARRPVHACNQNKPAATADIVDIRDRRRRRSAQDDVLMIWAAFAWWQSWETLRRALRRNDEDVGIRHLSPEFRCA